MLDPRVLNKLMSEVLCCFTENWNDSVQISNRSFAYPMRITKAAGVKYDLTIAHFTGDLMAFPTSEFCFDR